MLIGAVALSLIASAANAQLSPFGGFAPFEVNGPAAGANQFNTERCGAEQRGRGGIHYNCEDQKPNAPTQGR